MFPQTKYVYYPPYLKEKENLVFSNANVTFDLDAKSNPEYVNIVTTPKSGTHLLIKILDLLKVSYQVKSFNMAYLPHLRHYGDFNPDNFQDPEKLKSFFNPDEKYLITIRDPKDFLISYIQWLELLMEDKKLEYEPEWYEVSIEDKIEQILKGGEAITLKTLESSFWYMSNYYLAMKVKQLALPNIFFLKFEDLIGPELGGNSRENQQNAFKQLCEFTGVHYTEAKVNELIKNLPGGTLTFVDQKKVGKWVPYLKKRHIKWYKETFDEIEEEFGYSSNFESLS